MNIYRVDHELIHFFRRFSFHLLICLVRGFFLVWFFESYRTISCRNPCSFSFFDQTIHFMAFPTFYILFALFECLIGVLFDKRCRTSSISISHFPYDNNCSPSILSSWSYMAIIMCSTLEGQYIIKNLVIIATAIGLVAHLHPLPKKT